MGQGSDFGGCREQFASYILSSGPARSAPNLHDTCLEPEVGSLELAGPVAKSLASTAAWVQTWNPNVRMPQRQRDFILTPLV